MDPLTHTLVGANLASTPLGRKTRFAAAALMVGANLPDVDAILYFTGHSDLALGFRRGWTHGVLALVVLPLVLTGVLLLGAASSLPPYGRPQARATRFAAWAGPWSTSRARPRRPSRFAF